MIKSLPREALSCLNFAVIKDNINLKEITKNFSYNRISPANTSLSKNLRDFQSSLSRSHSRLIIH